MSNMLPMVIGGWYETFALVEVERVGDPEIDGGVAGAMQRCRLVESAVVNGDNDSADIYRVTFPGSYHTAPEIAYQALVQQLYSYFLSYGKNGVEPFPLTRWKSSQAPH